MSFDYHFFFFERLVNTWSLESIYIMHRTYTNQLLNPNEWLTWIRIGNSIERVGALSRFDLKDCRQLNSKRKTKNNPPDCWSEHVHVALRCMLLVGEESKSICSFLLVGKGMIDWWVQEWVILFVFLLMVFFLPMIEGRNDKRESRFVLIRSCGVSFEGLFFH